MSDFETTRGTSTLVKAIVVIVIISVGAVSALYLTGFFTPGGEDEEEGISIKICTRHDISIHSVFEPAFLASDFAKDNNITDIIWRTPAAEFFDDVIDNEAPDVVWGGGPTLFDQLGRDNRLAPLTSPLMATVADRVNDTIAGAAMKRNNTDGDLIWIAAAISSFGFTVNDAFLDAYSLPAPTTWTDLANVTYGRLLPTIPTIAMGNAPQTTSNTRIYEIITQTFGWEQGWITMARMAANAGIYPGSVETQNAAENGDVGISMSIDFYGYLTIARNPDCRYVVPEGQSIVNGDPIAVSATSTKKDLAEGFIDFVVSAYGQSLWLDRNAKRMPVMREAFDVPGLTAEELSLYDSFNATVQTVGIEFNDTQSLYTNGAFVPYWGAVYNDAHDELVDCWAKIIEAFDGGHINETDVNYYAGLMGTPITAQDARDDTPRQFTLAYALEINDLMIYNTAFASTMKTRWTAAAKIQYTNVMNIVDALIP